MKVGKAFVEQWDLLHEVLKEHIDKDEVEYSSHADERMIERKITKTTVECVLEYNRPHEMFAPYEYPYGGSPYSNPDPVFSVAGEWNDRRIVIGVAIKMIGRQMLFTVTTVFRATEYSRHHQN